MKEKIIIKKMCTDAKLLICSVYCDTFLLQMKGYINVCSYHIFVNFLLYTITLTFLHVLVGFFVCFCFVIAVHSFSRSFLSQREVDGCFLLGQESLRTPEDFLKPNVNGCRQSKS